MTSTRLCSGLCGLVIILVVACAGSSPELRWAHITGVGCGRDLVGSGVVVGDGLVVTSAHVVAGADSLAVEVGGVSYAAVLARFDAVRDLALLSVAGVSGAVEFADAGPDARGSILAANVDGQLETIDFELIRTIVATGGDIYEEGDHRRDALQLGAAIDPGHSGAAVVDDHDQVIGIAFASSRTQDAVTYAVASSEVEAFLAETSVTRLSDTTCP